MKYSYRRKLISILLIVFIVLLSTSISFAKSSKAKSVFSNILTTTAKELDNSLKIFEKNQITTKPFRVTKESKYPKGVDSNGKVDEYYYDNEEIVFDGNSYYISAEDFQTLYDIKNNWVYLRLREDEERDYGELVKIKMDDLPYDIKASFLPRMYGDASELASHLSYKLFDSNNYDEVYEDVSKKLKINCIWLKNLAKNLKDTYFEEIKSNDLTEYRLSLNTTQRAELLINTYNANLKDKNFLKLNNIYDKEELEKMRGMYIIQIDSEITADNLTTSYSIFAKGNIKKSLLESTEITIKYCFDGDEMDSIVVSSKDNMALSKSNDVDIAFNYNDKPIKLNIKINDKKGFGNLNKSKDLSLTFDINGSKVEARIMGDKSLAKAKKYTGEITIAQDIDSYEYITFDSSQGYTDIRKYHKDSEDPMEVDDSTFIEKFEILKKADPSKYLDIKNAREVNEEEIKVYWFGDDYDEGWEELEEGVYYRPLYGKVRVDTLNVYSRPYLDSNIINQMFYDEKFTVLDEEDDEYYEGWYYIQLSNESTGWIQCDSKYIHIY